MGSVIASQRGVLGGDRASRRRGGWKAVTRWREPELSTNSAAVQLSPKFKADEFSERARHGIPQLAERRAVAAGDLVVGGEALEGANLVAREMSVVPVER